MDMPAPGAEAADADPGKALAELESYCLVARAPEVPVFSVHRLVQEVTRRRQGGGQAVPPGLSEALRWVDAAFVGNPEDVRDWLVLDPLTPHARAVVARADSYGIADPTTRLMCQAGVLLHTKALHAEAEPLMRRAFAISLASFGLEHSTSQTIGGNYIELLKTMGKTDDDIHVEVTAVLRKA